MLFDRLAGLFARRRLLILYERMGEMKRRFRVIIFVLAGCLILMSFTACSVTVEDVNDRLHFNSRVDYQFSVPKSTAEDHYETEIKAYFNRVYVGDKSYLKVVDDNCLFIVGEDVKLTGVGVEQLDGAEFTFDCSPLESYFDTKKEFVQVMSDAYKEAYSSASSGDFEEEYQAAREKFSEYYDSAYECSGELVFHGEIYEDIRVETLTIPKLGLEFTPEKFTVTAVDVPQGVAWEGSLGDEAAIDYDDYSFGVYSESSNNMYYHSRLLPIGILTISGTAQKDIASIEVTPLSENWQIIDKENYSQYQNLPNLPDDLCVLPKRNDTALEAGNEARMKFRFAVDKALIGSCDLAISTFLMEITLADGTRIWNADTAGVGEVSLYLALPMAREEITGAV